MDNFVRFAVPALLIGVIFVAQDPVAAFPTGKERIYNIHNDVRIVDHKNGPPVGYRLTGSLRVGSVWGGDELKLLQFHLVTPQLHIPDKDATASRTVDAAFSYISQRSYLDTSLNRPFYAVWHLGAVTKIYVHGKEDTSLINLKKSLASLFQYQLLDGEYDEDSVSGRCAVGYTAHGQTAFAKVWRRCEQPATVGVHHRRADRPVGVRVSSNRDAEYRVTGDGTLEKVVANERHRYVVEANEKVGAELRSTLSLKFDGSISNIEVFAGKTPEEAVRTVKGLKKLTLQADSAVPHARKEDLPFKTTVVQLKEDLTDEQVGTDRAALALLRLTGVSRVVDMAGFLKVLKAHTMQELRPQLIDVLAAAQTADSHEAALRTLKFTSSDDKDLSERYLQGLAVGTRPVASVVEDLLRQAIAFAEADFEEPKVRDTLVQTVSAMGRRLATQTDVPRATEVAQNVQRFVSGSLAKCSSSECKELYLRGLNNLQSPHTVPELIAHLADPEIRVAVAAMKALRGFPRTTWSAPSHRQLFRDVFYQLRRRYDSSVRTLALDVLLELSPSDAELRDLVAFVRPMAGDPQFEVRKYVLQQLLLNAERCAQFARRLRAILVGDAQLNNYHVLGQRGLTTVLARTFARAPSFNGTVLSVQEIHRGVLKRGIVDMSVSAAGEEFSVFTLGLYAGGLSSFIASGNDDANENDANEEPANAGMEVTVQGAYLRPLQFFGSQGELMGHAWSGTASEPTAAYQATTLLHDHHEEIALLNGAAVSVRVLGAVSIDLSGQVQFSLWNRNAHCQVDKNAGIAVRGTMSLETSFVNVKSVATVTQEPKLALLSDIDFAGAPKLCIQLSQPATMLTHDIEKITRVHGTNVLRSNTQTHRYHLPGVTHALNQKNNEMCGNILAEDG